MTQRKDFLVGGLAALFSPTILKASPVRSMLGAEGTLVEESTPQIELPYITDGLIAIWDGIMNGAGGVHNPEGGLVELLSGTETYIRRGSYTVEDDCIKGDAVVIASPPIPAIVALNGSGNLTIEGSCENSNSGRPIQFMTNRPFANAMYQENGTYWMAHDACTEATLNSKWASGFRNNERRSRTLVVSSSSVQWFIDGVPDSKAARTKDFSVSDLPFSVFGWDWDFGFPATGAFCAVRFYNRALSEEEVAYNYSVDKERFGIL